MEHTAPSKKVEYKSESSIFVHPIQFAKKNQLSFPTWFLVVFLIATFFLLKTFIYISDKKRHGK